jgi:hypothetical protein
MEILEEFLLAHNSLSTLTYPFLFLKKIVKHRFKYAR